MKFIVFDAKQSPTDNFNTWSSQVKAHPDALAYVGPGSQAAVSLSRIIAQDGQEVRRRRVRPRPGRARGRQGRARHRARLARALAQGLPRDQADGRVRPGRRGPARGHVELRRADRRLEEHRRDHRPPEGRGVERRSTSSPWSTSSSAAPTNISGRCPDTDARGDAASGRPTAASSRWPAWTSRSAPARCTPCWGRTARGSPRWSRRSRERSRPTRARCAWTGRRCGSRARRRRSAAAIAVVSQELNVFPDLDVLANLYTMREIKRGPF